MSELELVWESEHPSGRHWGSLSEPTKVLSWDWMSAMQSGPSLGPPSWGLASELPWVVV